MGWEKDWVKYEEKFRKLYPTRSKRKYKWSDCEGVADGFHRDKAQAERTINFVRPIGKTCTGLYWKL